MWNIEGEKKSKFNISKLMESFGKYQITQYALICLPAMFIDMITINYVFIVGDVDYRCRVDECENVNSTVQFPSWWPDASIDRCSRPVLKTGEETCTNDSFTGQLVLCDHWIYESNNTVVAELNLACQPFKSNLVGTIHSVGMMVSMIVAGWTSDKFGRKPTLIVCVAGGSIGYLKTFATSYNMYIIIEFLEAAITGGTYTAAVVLFLEIAGNKYRVLSSFIFAYSIYFAECIYLCIALFGQYWKTINYFINGPCITFIFLSYFINESPRWQIVSGKICDAKKIMKKVAKDNKVNINDEQLANISEADLNKYYEVKSYDVKESYIDAVKSMEIMKRLLVVCVGRFTTNFVYFGMMVNSVWLPGDKYLNFFLSTLMSFPGEIFVLVLMNKVGRKLPLSVGFSICGGLCIISASIPARFLWIKLSTFLIAKVIIAGSFTGTITYAAELFPTSVRGSLLGLCSFASQIGGMLAPLTPILNTISRVLPLTLFGCSAILTGVLFTLLPETRNLPLFDTIKQVEHHCKTKNVTEKDGEIKDCSLESLTGFSK